jgi:hypothetical protein
MMFRRCLMLMTSCIIFGCLLAGTAQAKWGPTGSCGIRTAEHCYATSERSTSVLASIDAADNETAIVSDWQNGAFYDQEQWVTWPNAPYPQNRGWVEAGITEGNYIDCCTAYPFYATETQTGAYHEHLASGPVASGSGQYNFNLIYDTTHNGVYHVYWSSATNTANWFEVAQYGGGRPGVIQYQEAGLEVATETNPYHAGRQEVAAGGPNPPEWSAWTGAKWSHDRGICIGSNRELGAAGNIEWTPGHNEC